MEPETTTTASLDTCPHCHGAPCMPMWRKVLLGPASSTRCRICGYKVGVAPLHAVAAMLPLFLLTMSITAGLLHDAVAAVVLLFLLLAAGFLLYAFWVPLAPKEITNPRFVAEARARIAAEKAARK